MVLGGGGLGTPGGQRRAGPRAEGPLGLSWPFLRYVEVWLHVPRHQDASGAGTRELDFHQSWSPEARQRRSIPQALGTGSLFEPGRVERRLGRRAPRQEKPTSCGLRRPGAHTVCTTRPNTEGPSGYSQTRQKGGGGRERSLQRQRCRDPALSVSRGLGRAKRPLKPSKTGVAFFPSSNLLPNRYSTNF